VAEKPSQDSVSDFETGPLVPGPAKAVAALQRPEATILRFQDFVERPLRSTPPSR